MRVKIGMCPSRAISFYIPCVRDTHRSAVCVCVCVSTPPPFIDVYNKTNRSSTDMSLSACICRSPATAYKWKSFAVHAILMRDTTYYSDESRVHERARIYVYVTILTDFFASSPSAPSKRFLSSRVHLSRVTPESRKLANT